MMIVPWGGGSNFCGRLLLLDLRSCVRQSMLKKIIQINKMCRKDSHTFF